MPAAENRRHRSGRNGPALVGIGREANEAQSASGSEASLRNASSSVNTIGRMSKPFADCFLGVFAAENKGVRPRIRQSSRE